MAGKKYGNPGCLLIAALALLLSGCSVYDDKLLNSYDGPDGGTGGDASSGTGGEVTGGTGGSGGVTATGATLATGGATGGAIDIDGGMDGGMDGAMPDGSVDGAVPDASMTDSGVDAGAPSNCGLPVYTDSDGDGLEDCEENCPQDPNKTEPGFCGCGYAEIDDGTSAGCEGLKPLLSHRYRFDGSGAVASDTVGSADGQVINTSLTGDGVLHLAGGTTNQYVSLPAGIVSSLSNVTIEAWMTWHGGNPWQRLFDFGLGRPAGPSGACTTTGVQQFAGHFYYMCTAGLNWTNALAACSNGGAGGSLISINSPEENSFAVNAGGSNLPAWTGGNDRGTEGAWFWAEGNNATGTIQFSQGSAATNNAFTKWLTGEPNDAGGGEDCQELVSSGWNDVSCGNVYTFLCESAPQPDSPYTTFYFTPERQGGSARLAMMHRLQPHDLNSSTTFPADQRTHVAVVFDDDNDTLSLYIDGQLAISEPETTALADIEDFQNYIGRSLYNPDDELNADVDEFRIYNSALSADHINLSRRAGPDPGYLD